MTITAEQLDELERKARAVDGNDGWYESHLMYLPDADARHIAANSPDVTLQLVAIARAALEKDQLIAALEAACESARSGAAEAVEAHDAQVARIDELEGQLKMMQIAPVPGAASNVQRAWEAYDAMRDGLNAANRKIAELEAGLREAIRLYDSADSVGLTLEDQMKFHDLRKLLPSENQ